MPDTGLWSIGHGNRPLEEFLALLAEARIGCLVDVRAYPASRRHPQFARAALETALPAAGIGYLWEGKALGGRRKSSQESPHIALRNSGFRAYADHMMTDEFQAALERLIGLGRGRRTAVMCAERLPWQCHRYFISDSLVARGVPVTHLISPQQARTHELNKLARSECGRLVYDAGEQLELGL